MTQMREIELTKGKVASKHIGVFRQDTVVKGKTYVRWVAQLYVDKKLVLRKSYKTEEEAIAARGAAVEAYARGLTRG